MMNIRTRDRFRSAALSVLVIAGGLAVSPAADARPVPAEPTFPTPTIVWVPCADVIMGAELECATVAVPLDYDSPSGPTVDLAVNKLPATGAAGRKGSLFLNPGGPGGSGVSAVRDLAGRFPPELQAAYDIVGFDPRGVGQSTPLRCFTSRQDAESAEVGLFPEGAAETADREARQRRYAQACRDNGGPLLDHMSTANVARDLDVLRRAVGDAQLNYLGYSYGTYLGQTYAALFPHNVGAFVLDGVLDPVAWATGQGNQSRRTPYTTRVRSDAASEEALQEFFARCDEAGDRCAFSGDAAARFEALLQRLALSTLPYPGFPQIQVDDRFLLGATGGALYTSQSWPDFAEFLAALASEPTDDDAALADLRADLGLPATATTAGDGAAGTRYTETRNTQARYGETRFDDSVSPDESTYGQFEAADAVGCSDTDNPSTFGAWATMADRADARHPHFGRSWAWQSSVCAFWLGRDADRYTGPFRTRTAHPVLLVGNYHDPSTGFDGAVAASKLLKGSRLLAYAGWGHKAYLTVGNACVDDAVTRYLVTNELPARGTVCQPERSPFDIDPTADDDLLAARQLPAGPGPALDGGRGGR